MRSFFLALSAVFILMGNVLVQKGWSESQANPGTNSSDPSVIEGQPEVTPQAPKRRRFHRSKLTKDESEAGADRRRLLLTTGEDKAVDLEFEPANRDAVSIGNPKIVATQFVKIGEKRQIVFKPLAAGETNITVRDDLGTIQVIFNIRVTGSNLLRIAAELRTLLRDIEGLDIHIVGSKVIMDGEVLIPADYARLISVIQDKSYIDYVINLTTLSPVAMQFIAKRIQEDIVASGAANVTARVVNNFIFLEGSVDTRDQAERAEKIAFLYLPDIKPGNPIVKAPGAKEPEPVALQPRKPVQSFIVINPPPQKKQEKLVRVTVHFVELQKDYAKLFAFKWQPGFTADPTIQIGQTDTGGIGTGANGGVSFSATLSSLLPKLQTAQSAGYARVLKTGTVIVRSGQPAKLVEQTSYPYVIQGANNQLLTQTTNVGLDLAVTPQIVGQSDDIQLDLDMNQIDPVGRAPASGGPPVTATHQVKTKIYVKSNESAAVAGVTSNIAGTDFNKDDPNPGTYAPQTDPLFTLLRSRNYKKQKAQFVIFVTPQIIESASEGTEDLKKNFRIHVK